MYARASRLVFRSEIALAAQASTLAIHAQQALPLSYTEIPGPKPLPIIGNAWRLLPIIGTFNMTDMMAWAKDLRAKYGDIVRISGIPGRKEMVFVYNPDDIENVLRNEGAWPERIVLESLKYYRTHVRDDFFQGNQGLLNENGEKWKQARTVINQPMMQTNVAKKYLTRIDQVARDFVKKMHNLRNEQNELPTDFNNELHKWALESIALVALDTRLGCLQLKLDPESDQQRMIHAAITIIQSFYELDFKLPIWKIVKTPKLSNFIEHCDTFLRISLKYVQRSQDKIDKDELSVLQHILLRESNTTRAVVTAMDIMLAGIDTTSNTAAFLMYHLAKNPEKQERLFEELYKIMPDSEQPMTPQMLDEMKYLKACIKEALRLSPVATATARTLTRDVILKNYLVPKGTEVLIYNSLMCRLEQYFPDADQFQPERWLRTRYQRTKPHPFVFLPFGYGPRQCVGMRFANMELETFIARVIRDFRLEWHHADLKYVNQIVIRAASPLQFTLINRV